jgi:hypothetical protein
METIAIVLRRALPAIAMVLMIALTACATVRVPRLGKSSAVTVTLRELRVVSTSAPPRVRDAPWQPTKEQSSLTGALAGGGAAAGIGAGVCTAVLLCPVCYPGCVALWGLGGLAVGAVGGQVAHAQLAFDPANRMLPDSEQLSPMLRSAVLARLAKEKRFKLEDGGAQAVSFGVDQDRVADPRDATARLGAPWILEVGLSEIRAVAMRKGGFEVQMTAHARQRTVDSNAHSAVEEFSYASKHLKVAGGLEAQAARIEAEVKHGMDEMADEIAARLLEEE